jgi:pimeloyl-ACP methyl ester carboxylesterase
VAFIDLPSSPLAPGRSPVRIHYRDAAGGVPDGPPIVVLHGGWGYEIYPFDRQIETLGARYRFVIPDRSGYGASGRLEALPTDFHHRAMAETRAFVDALGLERPVLWGHSDGAIIALLFGLAAPERIAGVIVEATHFYKVKPGSRSFFAGVTSNPQSLGGVAPVLAREHGDRWLALVEMHSRTWRRISDQASSSTEDFYGGRLGDLQVPALVVHGARDPRTEPGELAALRAALAGPERAGLPQIDGRAAVSGPPVTWAIFDEGGHSPHSERATADDVTRAAASFMANLSHPADAVHPAHSANPARP